MSILLNVDFTKSTCSFYEINMNFIKSTFDKIDITYICIRTYHISLLLILIVVCMYQRSTKLKFLGG